MKADTCGGFPKLEALVGDPHNKDNSILGFILGSPYLGKLPCMFGWPIVLEHPAHADKLPAVTCGEVDCARCVQWPAFGFRQASGERDWDMAVCNLSCETSC